MPSFNAGGFFTFVETKVVDIVVPVAPVAVVSPVIIGFTFPHSATILNCDTGSDGQDNL